MTNSNLKKKIGIFQLFSGIIIIMAGLLVGCVFHQPNDADGTLRGNYQAKTEAGKVYQNLLDLQV